LDVLAKRGQAAAAALIYHLTFFSSQVYNFDGNGNGKQTTTTMMRMRTRTRTRLNWALERLVPISSDQDETEDQLRDKDEVSPDSE